MINFHNSKQKINRIYLYLLISLLFITVSLLFFLSYKKNQPVSISSRAEIQELPMIPSPAQDGVDEKKIYASFRDYKGVARSFLGIGNNPEISQSDQEKLKAAGLEDFIPLYIIMDRLSPVIAGESDLVDLEVARTFYSVSKRVVSGEIDGNHPDVIRIRDGWGEKSGEIERDMDTKISGLTVRVTDLYPDKTNPEEIKSYFRKIGKVLPYYILAIPDIVEVGPAFASDQVMGIAPFSPYDGGSGFVINFHEMSHELNLSWQRVKPYIPRDKYLGYIQSYLESTLAIANSFLTLPEEIAIKIVVNNFPTRENDTPSLTDLLEREKSIPGYSTIPIPVQKQFDYQYRRYRLLHYLGQKVLHVLQGQVTDLDKQFLESQFVRPMFTDLLANISHSLDFPITYKTGLARFPDQIDSNSLAITGYHLAFHLWRLQNLSSVGKDADLQTFQDALGFNTETSDNNNIRNKLTSFGAKEIDQHEYLKGRRARLYVLPDNPFTPEKKVFYVEFVDRLDQTPNDILLSVPKIYFDVDYSALFLNMRFEKADNLILDIPLSENHTVTINIISSFIHYYSVKDENVQILMVQPNLEEISLAKESVVTSPIIMQGDLKPSKSVQGFAIWHQVSDISVRLYPLSENYRPASALIIPGYPRGVLLLSGNETLKSILLPDGTPDDKMDSNIIREPDTGKYIISGHIFTVDQENNSTLQNLVENPELIRNKSLLAQPVYRDGGNSGMWFYLLITTQDGKLQRFKINPFIANSNIENPGRDRE